MSENPVATLHDGRTIDKTTTTQVVAAGAAYVLLTFPYLEHISAVLEIVVTNTSPKVCVQGIVRGAPSGNIVGLTICGVAAGSTITVEGVALGW